MEGLKDVSNGRIERRKDWKDCKKKGREGLREEKNGRIEEERKNEDGDRRRVKSKDLDIENGTVG
jgi:hypothetical protein